MKKRVFLVSLLLCVSLVCNVAYATSDSFGKSFGVNALQDSSMDSYVELYIQHLYPEETIRVFNPVPLYHLEDKTTVAAVLYSVNNEGYAIINVADWSINEFSLVDSLVFDYNPSSKYFYGGLFSYFVEVDDGIIYSLPEMYPLSDIAIEGYSQAYRNAKPDISYVAKQQLLIEAKQTNLSMQNEILSSSVEGANLPYNLTTLYVNSKCVATSMAAMCRYYATKYGSVVYTDNYYEPNQTGFINNSLHPYLEANGGLSGASNVSSAMNSYFSVKKIQLSSSYSSSWNFDMVKNSIISGCPISIGGPAQIFDPRNSGGHSGVIHGYSVNGSTSLLLVNDSWGHNNVNISWLNTSYPWLTWGGVDHIKISG